MQRADPLLAVVQRIAAHERERQALEHRSSSVQHLACCPRCGCILLPLNDFCPDCGADDGFRMVYVAWIIGKYILLPALLIVAVFFAWFAGQSERVDRQQELDLIEMRQQHTAP